MRFRVIGGSYRIVIQGRGIDLSAVGKGIGSIEGDRRAEPGVYSLDGADCRKDRAACELLPDDREALPARRRPSGPRRTPARPTAN